MKKVTLETVGQFLLFRACCELYKISFEYWSKPNGVYIVEAPADKLEIIGY